MNVCRYVKSYEYYIDWNEFALSIDYKDIYDLQTSEILNGEYKGIR